MLQRPPVGRRSVVPPPRFCIGPPGCSEERTTRAPDALEVAGSVSDRSGGNGSGQFLVGYSCKGTRRLIAIRASVPYCAPFTHSTMYPFGVDPDAHRRYSLQLQRFEHRTLASTCQLTV